jgi:phytoene dehydrogenase-like protein
VQVGPHLGFVRPPARCRQAHDLDASFARDINGGLADLGQLLFRPVTRLDPYATAIDNVFLCSSSTPPGGGLHGMCGFWAAQTVLRKIFPEVKHTST